MILYTNGCSFTQGHDEHRIIDSKLSKKDQKILDSAYAWPRCLDELTAYFDEVINEAWVGGSNDRIIRRTLEYVHSLDNIDDHVFIIQFTNPLRSEFFDPDINFWTGTINDAIMYDDLSCNADVDKSLVRKLALNSRSLEMYKNNVETTYINFLTKLVAFDTIMRNLGCTFFYTGMSHSTTPLTIKRNLTEYVNNPLMYMQNHNINSSYPAGLDMSVAKHQLNLINAIPDLEDKCLLSISEVARNHTVSKDDSHPNKTGHRLFARYIFSELQSREII